MEKAELIVHLKELSKRWRTNAEFLTDEVTEQRRVAEVVLQRCAKEMSDLLKHA